MSLRLPSHPAAIYVERRARFARELAGIAALLPSGMARPRHYAANAFPFRPDSSFFYLTGLEAEGAQLWLDAAGKSTLFLPALAQDDALWHGAAPSWSALATATGIDDVVALDHLQAYVQTQAFGIVPAVDAYARHQQIAGFRPQWTLHTHAHELTTLDRRVVLAMVNTRLIHDAAALSDMRQAARVTTAAHGAAMAATRPGRYEYEIAAVFEYELKRHHCDTAYSSIITVHGEALHNHAHDNRMAAGDLLLVDAGAEYRGWASDVTRVWPVSGEFSATQRTIYEIVLAAELDAIAKVKSGVRYRDIHLTAARTLTRGLVDLGILRGEVDGLVERGAHAIFFPHGVGHLIGMDVHDMENFGDLAGYAAERERSSQFGLSYLRLDRELAPGMTVTIEPGFYQVPAIFDTIAKPFISDGSLALSNLARFADVRGIRIEDDVLCTSGEPDVLTAAIPKDIAAVEAAVRNR